MGVAGMRGVKLKLMILLILAILREAKVSWRSASLSRISIDNVVFALHDLSCVQCFSLALYICSIPSFDDWIGVFSPTNFSFTSLPQMGQGKSCDELKNSDIPFRSAVKDRGSLFYLLIMQDEADGSNEYNNFQPRVEPIASTVPYTIASQITAVADPPRASASRRLFLYLLYKKYQFAEAMERESFQKLWQNYKVDIANCHIYGPICA
ncbi:hypothetical protein TIFTF001_011214 [Ficus carica]|uniref:Uncharacterized protein n=1 Tax=Ficus carica TaxID=3494 RepID=A0AA87ZRA5_FICCA|nr:hypothetical protein TIFTF001_011214 [Ficus carica]